MMMAIPPAAMATPYGKVVERAADFSDGASGRAGTRPPAVANPSVARCASIRPPQRRYHRLIRLSAPPGERGHQHEPDELLRTRPQAERRDQLDVAAADQLAGEQGKTDHEHHDGEAERRGP